MTFPTRRTASGVAYSAHGRGPAVAFAHGLTLDRHTWAPVIAALGDDIRALAIDLPLHGESRDAPGGLDAAARAVLDVLDAESSSDAVLVGHSLGAAVVAAVAAATPARGAIHVDQPLRLAAFTRRVQALATPPPLGAVLPAFREALQLDRLPAAARDLVDAHCDPREEVFLAYWGEILEGDAAALDARLAGWLATSSAPLLAIHARDPGVEYRAWLAQVHADARIEVWPDGGHFPHLVRPEELAARIRALASGR